MEEMRRIFAFAYSKNGNTCDAEDLSQDILLEILRSDPARAQNRQAWINGICRHVWSQYLKRNKPHWQAVGNEPAMEYLPAGDDAAIDAERNMEYDRLRQEIAYLSRTRRKVLAMYYFDNMSVEDIAVELEISAATVRWHMSRARSDLKERLDMENRNGIREKIRLKRPVRVNSGGRALISLAVATMKTGRFISCMKPSILPKSRCVTPESPLPFPAAPAKAFSTSSIHSTPGAPATARSDST